LLKAKSAFGFAHEVLTRAASLLPSAPVPAGKPEWAESQRIWIVQQRALCTYKDPSQASDTRLRKALAILDETGDVSLQTCKDPETLGLAGAIYKRLWETNHTRENLDLALAYYRRAYRIVLALKSAPDYESNKDYDGGAFAGANLMFLCDARALETPDEVDPDARRRSLEEAAAVRRQLAHDLESLQRARPGRWWIAATLLDALFGLACQDSSIRPKLTAQAALLAQLQPSPWERQSTGLQLLRSARLHKGLGRGTAAEVDALLNDTFDVAFKGGVNTAQARFDGKLGLALSGGGFRASMFHIGVLARLAELDLLRHVEVISCVSGGSIVGAHYYLLLRDLLQKTPDGSIVQADYVKLVEKLLDQFLAGVQKNIRMRVAASWLANVRMIFQPGSYSRTQRLGGLYEKFLYGLVTDGEQDHPRWLNEAFIVPKHDEKTWEDNFSPKLDNWRRGAKVPMLVLNATTLNTGRNWQFTASYMGEPLGYGTTVDSTERLDVVYYNDAPEKFRQYRLGEAVAASSCVPALFTPIVLDGLFRDRTVRLVDGGVHDNQGTRALLDQDCDTLIVSDASGQMASEPNPPHGELGVVMRTNSVLQARIRVAQHQELEARVRTGLLRRSVYLHLRKEIEAAVRLPLTHDAGKDVPKGAVEPRLMGTTSYGIDRQIQRALASVRTDLDSFTDCEAFALMLSGYRMAQTYVTGLPATTPASRKPWPFERISQAAKGGAETGDNSDITFATLLRHLKAGSKLAFKVWHLHPALNAIRIAFLVAVGVSAVYLAWHVGFREQVSIEVPVDISKIVRNVSLLILTSAAVLVAPWVPRVLKGVKWSMNPGSTLGRIAFGVIMASVGWFACRLHLWVFDRAFRRLGRVKRDRDTGADKGPAAGADPEPAADI
jgi:predicted acylesterase/phospholipase RssA